MIATANALFGRTVEMGSRTILQAAVAGKRVMDIILQLARSKSRYYIPGSI
jgi:hypothetical protein